LRINAALYLFRSPFLCRETVTWLNGRHVLLEIPDLRAFHIDSAQGLQHAELLLGSGMVKLPWLQST
jgi:CMP-N,N'-diacetyllegionaminic acid synthase